MKAMQKRTIAENLSKWTHTLTM